MTAPIDTKIDGAFETTEGAMEALLKQWNVKEDSSESDAPKPSDEPSDDEDDMESEDQNESDESDEDEGDSEESEDEPKSTKVVLEADADAYVKHKVDGKEIEIKVGDLARLYGQEAALTRKSQEVAELRKQTEEINSKYVTGLEAMVERAKARWEPYSQINWIALTKDPNVSQEDLNALHSEAKSAWDDLNYFGESLDNAVKTNEQARHKELLKAAHDAWGVLSNPDTGIKGWSEETYNNLTSFAMSEGVPEAFIKTLVDPAAFKILHKAYLYSKGQQATVTTKKTDKTQKRILKGSTNESRAEFKKTTKSKAQQRFQESGDVDDGIEALLERWGTKD